ncbi:Urease accessory protein UreF [Penicillium digitatum]|uniref:Urease accessory protein UreF n=3 Tax=Penicillium digitatum TaxID=36651 RepID=K9FRF8_PEND2|nr:hypothetical protein PDIP_17830 [Penicillium digitatum Pd1]EKV12265.1 hypothetical protein PDIG_45900 [Penicillium digitatum PHI26]EKV20302.1 hypothetical protein PDIP_17830 [Penicillium digitatum Pd1]QQK45387.1 Urease accessory protein UreF [Penicillium digitatum]
MILKDTQELEAEVILLESQLQDARARLAASEYPHPPSPRAVKERYTVNENKPTTSTCTSLHALLLLSDSALPLGSFAYSSGLESYLAHNKTSCTAPIASFHRFLKLSIDSIASTSLPYVLAGHRHPSTLDTLDNDLDASTPCIVAQRASIAQGRALIGVWERAFRVSFVGPENPASGETATAVTAIEDLSDALKSCLAEDEDLGPKGHFAPLWGVVCRAMGLDLQQTAYVFVMNHAKAVLSAAVRAGVMGPYQAQNVLASQTLQDTMMKRIAREWDMPVEQAGQVVPVLDLWIGRHELLYSRIFNS